MKKMVCLVGLCVVGCAATVAGTEGTPMAPPVVPDGSDAQVAADTADPTTDAGDTSDNTPGNLRVSLLTETPATLPASGDLTSLLHVHLRSTGAPVSVKKLSFSTVVSSLAVSNDWRIGDITMVTNPGPDGIPNAVTTVTRPDFVSTTFYFVVLEHELLVNAVGIDVVMLGRVFGTPAVGDSLMVSIETHPSWLTFHGSGRGSLTPLDAAIAPNDSLVSGPHIYEGTGSCTGVMLRGPRSPDVGNVSYGWLVWSDRSAAGHNDRDCQNGGSGDWLDGAFSEPPQTNAGSALTVLYRR